MTKFGSALVESAREARAIARGDIAPARAVVAADIDVKAIRKAQGMSQQAFADTYGFTVARLRDWEQGRYRPDNASRRYLLVIERKPEAVKEALATEAWAVRGEPAGNSGA
jgi:putative transcriptional regulator